jgi:CheY-like chemotaxis protein
MDSAQLSRIYESFEQLDSGLGRRYPGLGLGLTLAQGLSRILGGELHAQSEPGRGSRFTVRIPLETSTLESTFVLPNTKRILVVDDNDAARKVAEAYLRRAGYVVDLAASGPEALRLAAQSRYDLVVMDLQMPGMDGIETTTQLRGVHGYESTPVLAFTANSGDEYRRLCLAHGMQGYLPKPIDSDTLLQTIRRLL